MKKTIYIPLVILTLLLVSFASCRCSCTCSKRLGCKIIKVRLNSNDSIISRKYCSQINYDNTDEAFWDSIGTFFSTYEDISTIIENKDSIYENIRASDIECGEDNYYEGEGYICECYK